MSLLSNPPSPNAEDDPAVFFCTISQGFDSAPRSSFFPASESAIQRINQVELSVLRTSGERCVAEPVLPQAERGLRVTSVLHGL